MEKKDDCQKTQAGDEKNKPGIIVAGPEAHARERKGEMPVDKKREDGDETSPAARASSH